MAMRQKNRQNYFDIIIVGGGASGLFAGSLLSGCGKRVLILEKMRQCGLKLRLTGKGRCNLTNTLSQRDFMTHCSNEGLGAEEALKFFSNQDTIDYFEHLGLPLVEERGRRVFPKSGKSIDVFLTLVSKIESSENVEIMCNHAVEKLLIEQGSISGVVCRNKEVFRADKNDVVENKNRVAQNTAAFIDERIGIIGAELSNVEGEMAKFKQQNHLVNLQQTAQAVVSEAANARNKVIEAETQLQVARYLLEFLRDQSKAKQLIRALSVPAADAQIAQYNTQMNERNRLAANANEATQPIAELDRQLSALRTSIISSVQGYVRTIELQVNEARATEAALNGQVSAAPEKEKQALGIERQQALKAALYTYLLNKREEVALQLAINEANVRIVEYPMGSSIPVSPVHRNIVLIALVIGLCLPAGIIYLHRLFDTTIDGREDVEKLTSIPILGELPHWQQPNGNALISECEPTESIVEAFRVLRHGIHFLRRDARVFICTSSTPGQGKTFVSTNIAVALAMTGKRVLLVDGDIRRRTLSCKFRSTAGLTGILIEEDDAPISLAENVVVDAIYKGVDLLPSGIQPPNPAELLMSERLEKFVEIARASYDYIIFDATPAFAVADAEILSRVSDLMLYIIRVGVQDRNFLPDLEKFHKSGRFKNIGFIINDADKKTSIGFGYGYGYGYPHKKRG